MRPVARLLVVAALLPVLAGHSVLNASADDEGGPGGTAGGYIDDSGNPTAEAGGGGGVPSRPTASAPTAPVACTWKLINEDDKKNSMFDVNGDPMFSPTGRWYEKLCDGKPVAVNGSFAVPEQPPVDPAVLAQQARQSVVIPGPPMATSPRVDRRLYTQVPTWLWLDASWWRGYSATAEAVGVSSTVMATPVRAVWTMGDGGQIVCDGPGTQWRPGMADHQSTCSYIYRKASAGQLGGTFTMTVDVEFDVSWTSSIGPGGNLARITRSASRAVEVGEIQAVETQ